MAIESINGINMHTVTANDVKCKPSYFVEKSQSWVEGEKGRTISGTEIDRLKKKYNSSDMSNEKNVDFLGELVNLGVLSKATARYIYYGFAPIDIRSENVGNSQGFLQKDSGDTKMIATTGWTSSSRGYDYYEALFEQVKNVTTVDQKESLYLKDYSNYLRVLGRL
jgi:hypothetical protein